MLHRANWSVAVSVPLSSTISETPRFSHPSPFMPAVQFTLCAREIAGHVALSAAHSAVFEPLTYHTTPATIQ
jgi:hypothetical protein